MPSMTLEQMRTIFHMGGLAAARIVANGRRFHVVVSPRAGDSVMLVRHSDRAPRPFSDPGTAIRMLHDIGFRTVTVETGAWSPDQAELKMSKAK